jgi:hypothetical protein
MRQAARSHALVRERVRLLSEQLAGPALGGSVDSDLDVVQRGLAAIRERGFVRGRTFCEWGSGLGGVCAIAALSGFRSHGIEIRPGLVEAARAVAKEIEKDIDLPIQFAEGSFLRPGDEDLVAEAPNVERVFDNRAWEALDLAPADCDVVFAYPWPGEERCVDAAFARHASSGALLLTFHGWNYLLAQRKTADAAELESLGWL